MGTLHVGTAMFYTRKGVYIQVNLTRNYSLVLLLGES